MAILIYRPRHWIASKLKYNILLTIRENPDSKWKKLKVFFSDELKFNDIFTNLKNKGYIKMKFNIVNLTEEGLSHFEVLLYCYKKMQQPPEYLLYPQEKIMWLLCNNPYCKWSNFKQIRGVSSRVLHDIMAQSFKTYKYIQKVNLHGVKVYQLTRRGRRVFSRFLHKTKTEGYWIKQDEIEEHITDIQSHVEQFIFGPFKTFRISNFSKFKETLNYIKKIQKTFKKVEKQLNKLKWKIYPYSALKRGKKYKSEKHRDPSDFLDSEFMEFLDS